MTFEESFPSLKGYGQLGFIIGNVSVRDMIEKHCIEKQKIKATWLKLKNFLITNEEFEKELGLN